MSTGLASFLWDLTKVGGAGFVRIGAAAGNGWIDTFVYRTIPGVAHTKPVGGVNVGSGVYENRDAPTVDAVGAAGVTFNSTNKEYTVAADAVVQDRVFNGFVNGGNGALLVNCFVAGPPAEVTNTRALVQGPSSTGQMRLEFCTINPNVASAHYDGVGRGTYSKRCWITNVTDNVRAFSTAAAGARIYLDACALDIMAQFAPDYVNSRAETHNDLIQFQGNPNGTNNDIVLDGCALNARHSLTKGFVNGAPVSGSNLPYRKEIAAVMFTPQNSQGAAHGKAIYCWLEGGVFCVNAGSDSALMDTSSLEISYCYFERPGTDVYGDGRAPDIALAVDNSLQFVGVGNTYIDNGASVPVTSA